MRWVESLRQGMSVGSVESITTFIPCHERPFPPFHLSAGENADPGILVKKTARASSGLEVPFSKLKIVPFPIFDRQSPAWPEFQADFRVVNGWPNGRESGVDAGSGD